MAPKSADTIKRLVTEAGIDDPLLVAIAGVLTKGDETFADGTGPHARAGAWQVSIATHGAVPPDFSGQARQAKKILDDMRARYLANLDIDVRGRVVESDVWVWWWWPLIPFVAGDENTLIPMPDYSLAEPKRRMREVISIAILLWRWPVETGRALDGMVGELVTFDQVLAAAAPKSEAWIWEAVGSWLTTGQGAINPPPTHTPSTPPRSPAGPSAWSVLKWGAVAVLVFGGAWYAFNLGKGAGR